MFQLRMQQSGIAQQLMLLGMFALATIMPVANAAPATYPDRPIRLVVGFPPGQATDVIARILAKQLQEKLGQSLVVENKPGAGGINGAQEVARAPADGYTLLVTSSGPLAVNPHMYSKLPYKPDRDFTPVSLLASLPLYLAVNPKFPVKDFGEFTRLVREAPGKYEYASAGNGVTSHLTMELLKNQLGLSIVHVPYKGSGPAVNDVLGGQVPVIMDTGPAILPQANAGKLKVLAVSTRQRSGLTPQVPSIAELTKSDFDATAWVGVVAPKDTPNQIVDTLYRAIQATWMNDEVREKLAALGGEVKVMDPSTFHRYIEEESVKFGRAVKLSGARVD